MNAPDARLIGLVAGALGVDESFVEKDWHVVRAIRLLVDPPHEHLTPVFSGGTSLLKGHQLIRRFSEDMDFKLQLSPAFLKLSGNARRNALSAYRDDLVERWKVAGFTIGEVITRDAGGFIRVEMTYDSAFAAHAALRPHVLAEISAKPPGLRL